jgi:hypothetical protein
MTGRKPAPINCDYLGMPPILDTDIEVIYRCNAVYSNAPDPMHGKPCRDGKACFDQFNMLCRIRKARK